MAVQADLLPSHSVKTLGVMKAERTVKRATHNPNAADPGSTLYVAVPKLHPEEAIVPGTLALLLPLNSPEATQTTISSKMSPDLLFPDSS